MLFLDIYNEGDRYKAEKLYKLYGKLMYKIAYDIVKEKEMAEDAGHQAFIKIIRNLHKIEEAECTHSRNFVVIICRNVAINLYRQKTKVLQHTFSIEESTMDLPGKDNNPSDIVITKESKDKLVQLIKDLSPIYRDVLLLQRVYHYSREEIGKELGISVETVKKRLSRGKHILLEKLDSDDLR